MELLDLQVSQTPADQPDHVGGFGDPRHRGPLLPGDPFSELKRRYEPPRLDAPHPADPEEFASRSSCEAPETTTSWFEECGGHADRVATSISCTDQDGEKFGRGEGAGTEAPEALARTIFDWRGGGRHS